MKKILYFAILNILFSGFIFSVQALFRFEDDNKIPQWAWDAVETVRERNIMTGFGDRTFRPEKLLSRAEALVILLRTKDIDFENSARNPELVFSDVPRGEWFSGAVAEAVERGWIQGFPDGTFRPAATVNRAEWATMVSRAFELEREQNPGYVDVPSQVWFAEPIFHLAANELLREKSPYFEPSTPVSRADAAWVIAEVTAKPRLMGESATNEFSPGNLRDARRVAIKPRDFNPNKQGYDIAREELSITAVPREEEIIITPESDWVDLGALRVTNKLEDRVQLHSLEFKLRFERSNVGPASVFQFHLRGGGISQQKDVSRTGNIFISGIDIIILPGEDRVFRILVKVDSEKNYYSNIGMGTISAFTADGSMISTFNRENTDRDGGYRNAPVGFESRDLASFRFEP
ncbi:S-layer homology domain-containing protein [Candidatus Gracilibacteria bacterium]|nr:S-layer homology domain-containing protein [Candidatus Gracilibacteria bacterium]MCF7819654.1 S-layer homology domain-containing protein [Candidatus Gracilibacteria bacterium]